MPLLCAAVLMILVSPAGADEPVSPQQIRVGIIGLDTSHAPAFTKALNDENAKPEVAGCRVVAAYPQGSPDIRSSVERVPEYTEQVQKLGVEIVDSIDELLKRVDVVLLETNDGRPHLEQALPVLKAGKRMFIDKPMAGSLADAIAIFELARQHNTPIFTSSALRYGPNTQAVRGGSIGDVLGCDTYGPCHLEATHPEFFWYGIHGIEALFTVMGPSCLSVSRTSSPSSDFAVGLWTEGRIGTYRGMRAGKQQFGGIAFGTNGDAPVGDFSGYEPLVVEIVKFFRGGAVPVTEEETLAIFAFMEAADESKQRGGAPVAIEQVMSRAQEVAKTRLAELSASP